MTKFTLKFLVFLVVLATVPLMATGPRISAHLIPTNKNEIFALDMPPFISTEVNRGGMLSEIVTVAFSEEKKEVAITIVPLRSMIKYYIVQENALAVMGRHVVLEKEYKTTFVSFPLYLASESYVYYKPLNENKIHYNGKLSSLQGLTYGASSGEDVKAYKKESIKVKQSRALSMFKKLKKGSVDFISLPKESVKWFLNEKFSDDKKDFTFIDGSDKLNPIKIYFNLSNAKGKELAAAFKKGFRKITKNGKYISILEKYEKNPSKVKFQLNYIDKSLK